MLESIIQQASSGIRSSASQIAGEYGCIITSTLDVHMNDFPILQRDDKAGLVLGLSKLTAFALRECNNYARIVGFVAEEGSSCIIGITASGRPKILVVPTVVQVHTLADGVDSTYSVPAVGIYSLRAIDCRVRFAAPFPNVPYSER